MSNPQRKIVGSRITPRDGKKWIVLISLSQQADKLVFTALKKKLSLRTSPQTGVAIPPTIQDSLLGRLSVFRIFRKIWGIATPVCELARNDSVLFGVHLQTPIVAIPFNKQSVKTHSVKTMSF